MRRTIQTSVLNGKLFAARGLSAVDRKLAGAQAVAILAESEDGVFATPPGDMYVGRRLRHQGRYDQELLSALQRHVRPTDSAVVVGAHVGAIAIPLARWVERLVAVEPNPRIHRLLRWNVLLNEASNIDLVEVAASDHSGVIEFLSSTVNSGGSKVRPSTTDYADGFDSPATLVVRSTRLADVVPHAVDVLLIDAEGHEPHVLAGFEERMHELRVMVLELDQRMLEKIPLEQRTAFHRTIVDNFDRYQIVPGQADIDEEQVRRAVCQLAFEPSMTKFDLLCVRTSR